MKRLYASVVGLLFLMSSAFAQSPKQHLRIQISYLGAGQHLEQAVETIEAFNVVNTATIVDYQAGRSVTLLPGFEAKTGSTFSAYISSVTVSNSEFPLKLTVFPNPVEQSTMISYYLPTDGKVNLWITDSQGKLINQLLNAEDQTAGQHQIEWKPTAINAGIYVPVLEANQQKIAGRIIKK